MNSLVSVDWLNNHLHDADLLILDTSPKSNISGLMPKYEGQYIEGARAVDVKNFIDKSNPIPNTVMDARSFETVARKFGIKNKNKIVVYDNLGIYTSPRVWWMLRLMGHDDVAVLDGGLPAWIDKGCPVVKSSSSDAPAGDFVATYQPKLYRNTEDIRENMLSAKEIIIDARSSDRFHGRVPEPRANLRSGHIPKSLNIHFEEVVEDGKMKNGEDLRTVFARVDDRPLVFSCGSGTTACILMLAADQVLDNPLAIYDGSWSEWGSNNYCPISK